jgi:outer membrane lipoprotein carrier protein
MRVLFLILILFSSGADATSLERFQSYLRTTQTARGEFEQKVFDRDGKLVQASRGSFAFWRPGRFRWTYAKPVDQLIVGDGERVWIHDRDLNQVTVRRLARALGSTPAALLAGASDVEKAFDLTDAGVQDGLEWLDARPKERDAGFEAIRIGFAPGGIQAMQLTDHFGQRTELRFSNVVRNAKVDPAEFRFEPPAGADVLGEK